MSGARKTYRHGDVAEAGLTAARRLLEAGGAAAVSLRKIAAEIGVAHRALYNHFDNLEDLLAHLAAAGFAELAAAVRERPDPNAFNRAYLSYALAHPELYRLMMSRQNLQIERHRALGAAVQALIDASLLVFGDARLDQEENRRRVSRRWMLLHGGSSLHLGGVLRERTDEEFVAEMETILSLDAES